MDSRGRILAVDYGEKNIGLACSDELGLTVQPLPSLPNLGKKDFLKRIESTVTAMDIRELVLGVPYNMDGSRGDAVLRMQSMMEFLKSSLNIPLSGLMRDSPLWKRWNSGGK